MKRFKEVIPYCQTSNSNTFGHSWLYREDRHRCEQKCNDTVEEPCSEAMRVEAERQCALITDTNGRFKVRTLLVS